MLLSAVVSGADDEVDEDEVEVEVEAADVVDDKAVETDDVAVGEAAETDVVVSVLLLLLFEVVTGVSAASGVVLLLS